MLQYSFQRNKPSINLLFKKFSTKNRNIVTIQNFYHNFHNGNTNNLFHLIYSPEKNIKRKMIIYIIKFLKKKTTGM